MGFNFTQYAASQQEAELRSVLIMNQLSHLTIFPSVENVEAPTTNGHTNKDRSSSRPPSPPDSGTTTPRLSIGPCPARLTPYYPPPNYGCVDDFRIYRSSYPQDRHMGFVRSLSIKSVLTLVETEPTLGFQYWIEADEIKWAKLSIAANKDKGGRVDTSLDSICEALLFLMDASNYPVYVHCNQGKHRTGCVIACLRKIQGWALPNILEEYNVYAGEKSRPGDRALIKDFDPNVVFEYARSNGVLDGLSKSDGERSRIRRNDSTITDIYTLRAALEAGLLGEIDFQDETSSASSTRTATPNGMGTPLVLTNGMAQAEQVRTTDYVEDIRVVSRPSNGAGDVHMMDADPLVDGADGEA